MNPSRFHELQTPTLLLDVSKLDVNLQQMDERIGGAKTRRPHVKTYNRSM